MPSLDVLDVARVVAALGSQAPLATRTVVIPNARHLHQLRKVLLASDHARTLAGLDGLTPFELASRILAGAGASYTDNEEEARPTRVARRLAAGEVPEGFERDAILRARGWDIAFASPSRR